MAVEKSRKLPAEAPRPRRHRGDFLSPATRSAVMARIKGKDTGPELRMVAAIRSRRWRFETHARDLPGRPDIVLRTHRVAVFIDGDFWHGWRFPQWRDKLSEKWEMKIAANRRRDARNHARLRRMGWIVVRLWEHQIEKDVTGCVERISTAISRGKIRNGGKRLNAGLVRAGRAE